MQVNKAENNIYTKKPSKLNNLATGFIADLKLGVPVLSQYAVGDFYSKQKETAQNLAKVQDGKEDGTIKKIAKGFVTQLVYTIPVIGTYKIGKDKNNHDMLKNAVEAQKYDSTFAPKKSNPIKTYFKGLGEKIKLLIPVYSIYYAGKVVNETKNMYKDSQAINAKKNAKNKIK